MGSQDSYGTDEDASPYGSFTLDEIASVFEADGVAAGEPGEGDVCAKGFYTGRTAGPHPCRPGLIWKAPTRSSPTTTCSTGTTAATASMTPCSTSATTSLTWTKVDLIVFDPGDEATMYPASFHPH